MPMNLAVSKKVLKIVNDQNAISVIDSIVDDWLCRFNAALHQASSSAGETPAGFVDLFHDNSFWRDALALSWQLQTVTGATNILNSLPAAAAKAGISAITLDPQATAPRLVTRAGSDAIEAFLPLPPMPHFAVVFCGLMQMRNILTIIGHGHFLPQSMH
jgi:hypothetical protein